MSRSSQITQYWPSLSLSTTNYLLVMFYSHENKQALSTDTQVWESEIVFEAAPQLRQQTKKMMKNLKVIVKF